MIYLYIETYLMSVYITDRCYLKMMNISIVYQEQEFETPAHNKYYNQQY